MPLPRHAQIIPCRECTKGFEKKRHWQVFCSKRCKNQFYCREQQEARDALREKRGL